MSTQHGRRRAPALSPDRRRETIIEAALPLVAEHGTAVATRRIAEAAGIAEGTLFRVFPTKDDLLRACVADSFRLDAVEGQLRRTSSEGDLATRLQKAAVLIAEHLARLGTLMHALITSGYDPHPGGAPPETANGPQHYVQGLAALLAEQLEPDRHRFDVPAEELAHLLLGLITSLRFDPRAQDDLQAGITTRIEVLLHGALREEHQQPHRGDENG